MYFAKEKIIRQKQTYFNRQLFQMEQEC